MFNKPIEHIYNHHLKYFLMLDHCKNIIRMVMIYNYTFRYYQTIDMDKHSFFKIY